MRHGYVAGAACPPEVLSFMDSIGIPICEGYGLTETSPIICLNVPSQRQVGSVGKSIGGVTAFVVDEDGNVKSPYIFLDIAKKGKYFVGYCIL